VAQAADDSPRKRGLTSAEITFQENNPIAFSKLGDPRTKVGHRLFTRQVQG